MALIIIRSDGVVLQTSSIFEGGKLAHECFNKNNHNCYIYVRGSLVNSHLALQSIAEKRRPSVTSDGREVVIVEAEDAERGMLAVLREMMNFKLLFNPLFFLIGVSNAVGMIGFYTPFVYLPSMAAQYVSNIRTHD